jgi:hypothetical protein
VSADTQANFISQRAAASYFTFAQANISLRELKYGRKWAFINTQNHLLPTKYAAYAAMNNEQ